MTADEHTPLTDAEAARHRSRHTRCHEHDGRHCDWDSDDWPCLTVRLLEDRKRHLEALEELRDGGAFESCWKNSVTEHYCDEDDPQCGPCKSNAILRAAGREVVERPTPSPGFDPAVRDE